MRTTVDLPDELLKRAKIAAIERGVTLRDLIGAALRKELVVAASPETPQHLRFPLFPSDHPGALKLTNADLAQLEAAEDERRHGLSR
jgi:hypothetical protein